MHLPADRDSSAKTRASGTESAPSKSSRADTGAASRRPGSELKVQVNLPGGSRLGPGKIRLLEMIDQEGSLSRGASKMGISYRRAWLFVQQINAAFDTHAIATPEGGHGGGPARLTDFGRELVKCYRDMERTTEAAAEPMLRWLDWH